MGGRSRTAAAAGSRAGARARLRRLRAALVLLLAALLRGLFDPVAVEGLALLRRVLLPAAVVLARAVAAVPIGDLVRVRLLVALVGLVGGARGLARPAPVVVLLREAAVGRRVAAVALDLARLADGRAAPGLFLVGVLSRVLLRVLLLVFSGIFARVLLLLVGLLLVGLFVSIFARVATRTTYPRAPARESRRARSPLTGRPWIYCVQRPPRAAVRRRRRTSSPTCRAFTA